MLKVAAIALGGASGALMRYAVAYIQINYLPSRVPWATFVVNILGAFLIGYFWAFFDKTDVSQNIKLFTMVGLIGSLTTFSTFCFESVKLFQTGAWIMGISYIVISNLLGLAGVMAGFLSYK